jgi:hypothetical protein
MTFYVIFAVQSLLTNIDEVFDNRIAGPVS